jgi:hypothetical protein
MNFIDTTFTQASNKRIISFSSKMPEQEEAKQPQVNEYQSLRKLVTAGLCTGMLPEVTTSEFSDKNTSENKADCPSEVSSNNQDSRAKRNKEARRDVMCESTS